MKSKSLLAPLSAALLMGSASLVALTAAAHPPHSPPPQNYGATIFAPITKFGPRVAIEVVASGLTSPLKGVTAPGDHDHLYVVDQVGMVWKVHLPTKAKTVFHNVRSRLVTLGVLGPNSFDERGLLGLAFHPNYQSNGLIYTYTSEPRGGALTFPTTMTGGNVAEHQNVVAEWKVTGTTVGNRRELMRVDWPQFNHDGGDLSFGPDGMLYIAMGDGGGADDRDGQDFVVATGSLPPVNRAINGHGLDGNGQKLTNPLGKILRINVNARTSPNRQYGIPSDNPFVGRPGGVVGEIYAYGFRNPYRMSFDTHTGTLFAGDVGQNDIEEVNIVTKGGNYGWPVKEGTLFFNHNGNDEGFAQRDPVGPLPAGFHPIDPVAQYDTHAEGHSVIGGHVYRGRALPKLRGRYIFGEFSTIFNFPSGPHDYGRLLHINGSGSKRGLRSIREFHIVSGNSLGLAVLGMAQDADGEVYITGNRSGLPFGSGGMVLKIVPAPDDDDEDDHHDKDDD